MVIVKEGKTKVKKKKSNVLEKLMAFWATANLTLVLFDLSYIPLRDFWLQGRVQILIKVGKYELEFPQKPLKILPISLTKYYDWVKGIEPYRDTEEYLKTVEKLNNTINETDFLTFDPWKQEEEKIEKILAELREQSKEMIQTNPFQIANKTGKLEKIKNKMREHIFGTKNASSKASFEIFWSKENLLKNGIKQELMFFEREIKPLMETNYYRAIGENGQLVDNFGIIDFSFFTIYFAMDFLGRTWYISRSHKGLKWVDAMLWRWYDLLFFLPVLRWLRIIPVIIRLNEIGVIDLSRIQKQASQGFVAGIAEDLTEVVIIRIISQTQNLILEGNLEKLLNHKNNRQYIDINNTNEIPELIKLIMEVIVYQVMPKIEPEVEALITYSIEKSLQELESYQRLAKIPGINNLQKNLTQKTIQQIYAIINNSLSNLLKEDKEFDKLLENISDKFTKTMTTEIKSQESIERIETLLINLLEEFKINYIQKLSAEDIEDILEQKRALNN